MSSENSGDDSTDSVRSSDDGSETTRQSTNIVNCSGTTANTSNTTNTSTTADSDKEPPERLPKFIHSIVTFLQNGFMKGERKSYTFRQIVKNCNLSVLSSNELAFLSSVALARNPLVQSEIKNSESGDLRRYYSYKPPYDIPNKSSLLSVLKERFLKGEGGLAMDDLEKSTPHASEYVRHYGPLIMCTTRSGDKKQFLFYNDPEVILRGTESEIQNSLRDLWNSIRLEEMDDSAIENFLYENKVEVDTVEPTDDDEQQQQMSAEDGKKNARKSSKRPWSSKQMIYNKHVDRLLLDYDLSAKSKSKKTTTTTIDFDNNEAREKRM